MISPSHLSSPQLPAPLIGDQRNILTGHKIYDCALEPDTEEAQHLQLHLEQVVEDLELSSFKYVWWVSEVRV